MIDRQDEKHRVSGAVLALMVLGACAHYVPTPAAPERDVTITVAGVATNAKTLLWYHGWRAGECREHDPFVGIPNVQVPSLSFDLTCGLEVSVFAAGAGSWAHVFNAFDPVDQAWIENAENTGAASVTLPALLHVPVRIWLVADGSAELATATSTLNRLMADANSIFEEYGAGMTFDTTQRNLTGTQLGFPDCASSDAVSTNAAIYDPNSINVYFVRGYNIPATNKIQKVVGSYGITCWKQKHPEVIFVSWGNTNLPTPSLAHEFGHALGLVQPTGIGGHTNNDYPTFNIGNLMVSSVAAVTNISAGQVWRMNYGDVSWINRPAVAAMRPIVRTCQNSWDDGDCPPLSAFVAGWP